MARYRNQLTGQIEVSCDGCKRLIPDDEHAAVAQGDDGTVYFAHPGCVAAMHSYLLELAEYERRAP